jgi:shikimate dehydrogenase
MDITGNTRLLAILADPIHHVKAPQAINGLLAARGVDSVLVPIHVSAGNLETVVAGLRAMQNLDGLVITVPHKTAIAALCDTLEPHAAAIGAVNCIRRNADGTLTGTMLDGLGFVAGLKAHGIDPKGMRAYLAGAGGAANAIAFALAEAGVTHLTIVNRTRAKSDDLAARLAKVHPGLPVSTAPASVADHDLIVNATSLGLREGDALPLDVNALQPRQIVAEIIMVPEMTPLLVAAKAKGCRIHLGRPMLDAQLDLMIAYMGLG